MGDGFDCAEKLGTMECYTCDGRKCDDPAKNGLTASCPYGVYSCQMFVARECSGRFFAVDRVCIFLSYGLCFLIAFFSWNIE